MTALSIADYIVRIRVMTDGFGPAIRQRREEIGLNQTELAERAGVQRSHLSEVERGKIALPSADFRRRIANALGMSHAALLVAAGELTAEEAGADALGHRPAFPEGDVRQKIAALLAELRDDDAEAVKAVADVLIERRRTIAVEKRLPAIQQDAEERELVATDGEARLFPVDLAEDEDPIVVIV